MGKSLGEQRVRIDFNVINDDKVSKIKRASAELIDMINDLNKEAVDGEQKRCYSVAMTEVETAAMYAVKGATYKPE